MLRLDAITIAADDPAELKAFYETGFGATVAADHGEFVSYDLGPAAAPQLGVYRRDRLAADAGVPAEGSGFRGVTLSFIVDTADQVDATITAALAAGGSLVKPARNAMWGGYSGHVADPAGHLWKIVSSRRRPLLSRGRRTAVSDGPAGVAAKEVVVTLGADDVRRTKQFYAQGLGVTIEKDYKKFVNLGFGDGQAGMALYERGALADDAGVPVDGTGFRGFMLSQTAESADQVDAIMQAAQVAGGQVVAPPAKAHWGGYGGYFADPDGCLWKVASTS